MARRDCSASRYSINKEVVKAYHQQIDELRKELGYKEPFSMLERGIYRDIMQTMVRMPDIMIKGEEAADENEWQKVEEGVRLAISNLVQFRIDEGKKLGRHSQAHQHHRATFRRYCTTC